MPARFPRPVALALAAALAFTLPRPAAPYGPARAQSTTAVIYHAGWNLVAGPDGTTLSGVQGDLWTLAPDGSGYTSTPSSAPLVAGIGYWALSLADTQVALAPTPAQTQQLSLPAGVWTLAGNPFSEPVGLVGADVAYGFDPTTGFTPLTILPAGHAALVYSAAGGTLQLAMLPDSISAAAASVVGPVTPAAPVPSPAAIATSAATTPPAGNTSPPVGSISETAGGVTVLASGVGQAKPGGPVTVAAVVRNDGPNVDGTPVTITVYDAGGGILAAGDTTLHYLASGAGSAFAHRLTAHGSGAPASVQIETGQGKPAGDPQPGAISFSQVAINGDRSGLEAAAVLTSSYETDLSEVRVDAIAYDSRGAIVGGGETVDRLVPAGSATGVIVSLDVSTTPAHVDLYATLP